MFAQLECGNPAIGFSIVPATRAGKDGFTVAGEPDGVATVGVSAPNLFTSVSAHE
jgi:hypothetical protein